VRRQPCGLARANYVGDILITHLHHLSGVGGEVRLHIALAGARATRDQIQAASASYLTQDNLAHAAAAAQVLMKGELASVDRQRCPDEEA
jgi:hypothetical protein